MTKASTKPPSKFNVKVGEKLIPLSVSLFLVLLFSIISFTNPKPLEKWLNLLENLAYDFQVRKNHKPLGKDASVSIVDIDDKSLEAYGRWPWPRNLLADLVTKLYQAGATIVALDMTFPDVEENMILDVEKEIKKGPEDHASVIAELQKVKPIFDYDEKFAKSLTLGDSILGFVFPVRAKWKAFSRRRF